MQTAPLTSNLGYQALDEAGVLDFVTELLALRGITGEADVSAFLFQSPSLLADPSELPAFPVAVARIMRAAERGEKVAIFGDFDADGLTATALLMQVLCDFGIDATYSIPDRHSDGHGLSTDALAAAAERGVSLIITVDNGISAVDEIAFASEKGIDTIVTDHHKQGSTLPPAVAIIHDGLLSGAGVAFRLAQAAYEHKLIPLPDHLWALAAIGTISDRVPLVRENRIIVSEGLRLLQETEHVGLRVLKAHVLSQRQRRYSQSGGMRITEEDVAMSIAPMLNAPGRLGNADRSLKLLSATKENFARLMLDVLIDTNKKRQNLTRKAFGTAEQQVAEMLDKSLLVFELDEAYFGVLGLIATQLTKKYQKPAAGIVLSDGNLKGSIRADGAAAHVSEILQSCQDMLLKYGGHKNAGGFTIKADDREKVLARLEQEFQSAAVSDVDVPQAEATALDFGLEQLRRTHWEVINLLRPFGQGNPEPVFSATGIYARDLSLFGKNDNHLRGHLVDANGKQHPFVGFNLSLGDVQLNQPLDIHYQLKVTTFAGNSRQEIHLVSIKNSENS